ncbi:MAG: hypothetical protein ABEH66_06505 [Halobacteriales archaeon]
MTPGERRLAAAAALACLLVTAGCLGVLGSGTEPAPTASPAASLSPGETSTVPPGETSTVPPGEAPSPTPTVTPTRAAIGLPPGIGESDPRSTERIAARHGATLRNTSFTLRYSQVRIERGEVDVRIVGTVQYDGNGTIYSNYTAVDPDSSVRRSIEVWSNGTTARRAVTSTNGTFVRSRPPLERPRTFADRIESYLDAFDVGVSGYSRLGDESVVRVSGTGLDRSGNGSPSKQLVDQFWMLGLDEVNGGSVSMELEEGVFRRYRVEVVDSGNDRPMTLRETAAFSNLGTTTVRRPAWVTGRNESQGG